METAAVPPKEPRGRTFESNGRNIVSKVGQADSVGARNREVVPPVTLHSKDDSETEVPALLPYLTR
jgi:hypothetical protein